MKKKNRRATKQGKKRKKTRKDDKLVANPIGGITEPLRHLPSPSAAAVN
jgi:hypothetical protein